MSPENVKEKKPSYLNREREREKRESPPKMMNYLRKILERIKSSKRCGNIKI